MTALSFLTSGGDDIEDEVRDASSLSMLGNPAAALRAAAQTVAQMH